MREFKYKLKEILKPKDVDPGLIKRLSSQYGEIDMVNDFFNDDLTTYFKTEKVDKNTKSISHEIVPLASFSKSLKLLSKAAKSLKSLSKTKEGKADTNIGELSNKLKDVFNKYRTHIRKNYPDQYNQLKQQLEEISSTGGGVGAASLTPGTGMQYATPYAFKLKKKKKVKEGIGATLGPGPKASSDGVRNNVYVKQFKYTLVPKKIKRSGLEVKQLFEAETSKEYQDKRIKAFDVIETEINNIYKMLSNAKNETSEYYTNNPGSYSVVKPTDLILDYIKDIKDLLKGE